MKDQEVSQEQQTERLLLACLKEVPFLQIQQTKRPAEGGEWSPDLVIQIKDGGGEKRLVVDCKASGQPRLARESVNQLLVYVRETPNAYGIFAAPYISPRAAEICTRSGIGYLDLAGNCFISFERIFIKKEGKPNPFIRKRDLRSLYSPRSERVLRVLLSKPKRLWKVQELAKAADVSIGQAFNVKKLLTDREWISATAEKSRKGFTLSQPFALLAEWSENYDFRRNQVLEYYSTKSLAELEAVLFNRPQGSSMTDSNCALTGFSGAARLGALGRYQRVMAYVRDDALDNVERRLGLKRVTSGANVMLLTPYDEGVFLDSEFTGPEQVVSPVQVYLDLVAYRGRGEEVATQLLEEVIKPLWS